MLRLTVLLDITRLAIVLPWILTAGCSDDGGGGVTASGGQSGTGSGSGEATSGETPTTGGAPTEASGGGEGGGEGSDPTDGLGPDPVPLGTAGNYVILAKSAISNVPTSLVTGDLGLSPAAASYITGLDLTKAGTKWTSAQVIGSVFAADNDPPTPINLTTAVEDMQAAYTDAAGRVSPSFVNLGEGAIGGLTLAPGLYKWNTTVTIPADVTIAGEAEAVWIFQITGDLEMSAGQKMILGGGAQADNIVWQVAGEVDLGATSHAEGNILAKTAITVETGASVHGRLFAQTSVDIAGAVITAP